MHDLASMSSGQAAFNQSSNTLLRIGAVTAFAGNASMPVRAITIAIARTAWIGLGIVRADRGRDDLIVNDYVHTDLVFEIPFGKHKTLDDAAMSFMEPMTRSDETPGAVIPASGRMRAVNRVVRIFFR